MSRIFISYKRADKDKVFKIKNQIEATLGEKCWIDLDGIESDAQFMNVIIKAIKECEILLFMYSKTHAQITNFEKDWTIRELNFASKKNKRIVFVNIDGSPLSDEFEFMYGTQQQVDGTSYESIKRLIADIKKWIDFFDVNIPSFHAPKSNNDIFINSKKTQKFKENIRSSKFNVSNKLEAVDLGLPSKLKWANMNVGAITITDFGNYYAWGETLPKLPNMYEWEFYRLSKNAKDEFDANLTKYCNRSSWGYNNYIDNKSTLDQVDDVAKYEMGGAWRIPTYEEMVELCNHCFWKWDSDYKRSGTSGFVVYKAKSKNDKGKNDFDYIPEDEYSLDDIHIFLPAASSLGSESGKLENDGGYWTSSLYPEIPTMAFYLVFWVGYMETKSINRCIGNTIRAVCP